jgi:transposase
MSRAPALVLRQGDRERLAELARLPSVPSGLAKRARMVLLASDGVPNAQIARAVGVSRPTVIGWRDRYQQGGIAALDDEPRSGQPAEISEADVVVATLADDGRPPERLGITHWSARFLAAELGISFASVARIWRKWKIQPHRIETFKFSTDPELEAKIGCSQGTAETGNRMILMGEGAWSGPLLGSVVGRGERRWRARGPARAYR